MDKDAANEEVGSKKVKHQTVEEDERPEVHIVETTSFLHQPSEDEEDEDAVRQGSKLAIMPGASDLALLPKLYT